MKCPKCGFVGFDHLSTCAKCGKDLDAVRRDLNLLDFAPAVPAFVLDAIVALSQRAAGGVATAVAVASANREPGESLDLLGEIDLKVELDEKPEEITLELLDEGEESSGWTEPTGEGARESLAVGEPAGAAVLEATPLSLEEGSEDLDLKIDLDGAATQEQGVFDLSDVEDEPEFVESLDEEAMTDEALEKLRRELEAADGLLKDIDRDGAAHEEVDLASAVVTEPEAVEEAVEIEEEVEGYDLDGVDAALKKEEKDEDVFILMEERDGGLAVQEFSLEDTPTADAKRQEPQDDGFVLDLDALTDEEEPKSVTAKASEQEEPEIDGLVLELEDGFYIEPDQEDER